MAERPNLVFIFSDQQRADTMACYGNDWLNVPNGSGDGLSKASFRECLCYAGALHSGGVHNESLYPHAAGTYRQPARPVA